MSDWIDDILESEPISNSQIAIIEGLLTSVPYEPDELRDIENGMLHLSYIEASNLIYRLKEDHIPKDPREQFKKIFRYGN
jgi:hypothetical protein|tara:strand:+ start:428 stop:667 length:240 start_codon:yes stop_codon:yes gene_type:complete